VANLVKYHLQVTALDTSSSAIQTNQSAITSGVTNTGNITSTGTVQGVGGFRTTDDSGNPVIITVIDDDMGGNDIKVTRE
jgi:hypothetical protein